MIFFGPCKLSQPPFRQENHFRIQVTASCLYAIPWSFWAENLPEHRTVCEGSQKIIAIKTPWSLLSVCLARSGKNRKCKKMGVQSGFSPVNNQNTYLFCSGVMHARIFTRVFLFFWWQCKCIAFIFLRLY